MSLPCYYLALPYQLQKMGLYLRLLQGVPCLELFSFQMIDKEINMLDILRDEPFYCLISFFQNTLTKILMSQIGMLLYSHLNVKKRNWQRATRVYFFVCLMFSKLSLCFQAAFKMKQWNQSVILFSLHCFIPLAFL